MIMGSIYLNRSEQEMIKKMQKHIGALVLIFSITSLVVFGHAVGFDSEYEIEKSEAEFYCEMIDIFNATDGEYGWPATDSITCEGDE